jgi:tetratricopeptide (TPR) repeat protein
MLTPHEDADARKVDEAIDAIRAGQDETARRLLAEVVANTPTPYVYQYEEGDRLAVKFWDMTEFVYFVTRMRQAGTERGVVWQPSAYPRAHYYLAFLEVRAGNYEGALDLLDAGEKLEPNAHFALERAQALLRGRRDRPGALACYQGVLDRGDEVPGPARAVALRGKGFVLIELGQLDEAERHFHESLRLDPDSEVAKNELRYIAQLRAGGRPAPPEIVATGGQKGPPPCAVCGAEFKEGKVVNVEGRLLYLCPACHERVAGEKGPAAVRKWWQFWKRGQA